MASVRQEVEGDALDAGAAWEEAIAVVGGEDGDGDGAEGWPDGDAHLHVADQEGVVTGVVQVGGPGDGQEVADHPVQYSGFGVKTI